MNPIDEDTAYRALKSHDARFDGVFFVGVTSTGIYCRPICPARTPKRENCRFFTSAAAAEKASFRPCLRCRPELAPGHAPVDRSERIAQRLLRGLERGQFDDGSRLEQVAAEFGISSRQLRRIVQEELGVSPIELLQTRRLLLAKQLLTETRLPVTEIAYASGFSSLRRFNDAFVKHYRMPPSRLRERTSGDSNPLEIGESSILHLSYRPPYDWDALLDFLRARAIARVEAVRDGTYARTVRMGEHRGWILVGHSPARSGLKVEFSHSLTGVLPALLSRLRGLFDLGARPDLIAEHLGNDPLLHERVAASPGLRVPGAFDPFEMAVRAILGQQITVQAATTLSGRFAGFFGEAIETPFEDLTHLSPDSRTLAAATPDAIGSLGIFGTRASAILALARALESGAIRLDPGGPNPGDPEVLLARLIDLPGIGPWTAHYFAMRALRWPDAFPKEDVVLRKRLGGISAREAEAISQAWRPWRSYAVMHLWRG